MKLLTPLCAVVIGLLGCAYYNALYNANRLAADAERAGREGRAEEARALWSQAAQKAESVAVRFPDSRHRDDALLLQGRALKAIGDCSRGVRPLGVAADSSPDADLRSRARLELADCWLTLASPDSVVDLVVPEIAGEDEARRRRAFRLRGRAHLLRGNYAAAAEDLARAGVGESTFDLALALIGLDDVAGALEVLDVARAGEYRETAWLTVLDSIAGVDPELASGLVDGLVSSGWLRPSQRARALLADGNRWTVKGDVRRARARYTAAAEIDRDSLPGRTAAGRAVILDVRLATHPSPAPEWVSVLDHATRGGAIDPEIAQFAGTLRELVRLLEPTSRAAPSADLRSFLVAEAIRDSLRAPLLAGGVFRWLAETYPDSPVAPKALLAAAVVNPLVSDSLVAIVMSRYPRSPYVGVLRGDARAEFVALEDSLRTLLMGSRPAGELPADAGDSVARELPEDQIIRHGRRPRKP